MATKGKKPDPMKPSLTLLVKLGSIAVHVDEMCGAGDHEVDRIAIKQLTDDSEVAAWVEAMGAFLPVKRS